MGIVRSARLCVAALALGCVALGSGCAEERDPINQVDVGALPKAFFVGEQLEDAADDPEFYFRTTVVDVAVGAGSEELFTSSDAQPTVRIRWEITERKLIARLAYEHIDNIDGTGTGTGGGARNEEPRPAAKDGNPAPKVPARTTTDGQISRASTSRSSSTSAAATPRRPARRTTRSRRTTRIGPGTSVSTSGSTGRRTSSPTRTRSTRSRRWASTAESSGIRRWTPSTAISTSRRRLPRREGLRAGPRVRVVREHRVRGRRAGPRWTWLHVLLRRVRRHRQRALLSLRRRRGSLRAGEVPRDGVREPLRGSTIRASLRSLRSRSRGVPSRRTCSRSACCTPSTG